MTFLRCWPMQRGGEGGSYCSNRSYHRRAIICFRDGCISWVD